MLPHAAVERMASEAGFDLCGFARAEPIPPEVLGDWLAEGLDADMDWMGRRAAERCDVSRLLPGAKTVVSLACNFHWPHAPSPIAEYARGRDYHYTLKDRLRAFRRKLSEAHPEVKSYGSVDSGPVMEKVWAARAGLGHVGKNGLLITERFGSHVLLAALILDAEMDAYAVDRSAALLAARCGVCRRCIQRCPTHAILPGRRVDAGRCLSYQTIENEGEIPGDLAEGMAGRIFGCDICQEVCPLDRGPLPLASARFEPRKVAALGVRELAALSEEDYRALIPGTPLGRAGYDGLRRNALYALGAARDEGARALIERLCEDPSEKVRAAARWARSKLS